VPPGAPGGTQVASSPASWLPIRHFQSEHEDEDARSFFFT
jgi:hypothetical protein